MDTQDMTGTTCVSSCGPLVQGAEGGDLSNTWKQGQELAFRHLRLPVVGNWALETLKETKSVLLCLAPYTLVCHSYIFGKRRREWLQRPHCC